MYHKTLPGALFNYSHQIREAMEREQGQKAWGGGGGGGSHF